uniref:Mevalonate kinase n=1 Tax=Strongyloides venezuelensis TaxID=75913 RepID=A0A0K0FMP8_STRVS
MSNEIYVSAPGKIILFGEHAVVYGKTAVAGAINLRAYVKLSPTNDNTISLSLYDLNISKTWQFENIYTISNELKKLPNFSNFNTDEEIELSKELISKIGRIHENESHKYDIALEAFCYFITRLIIEKDIKLKSFNMSVRFELPASVGLGSSGAYCSSMIYTLFLFFDVPFELKDVVNYGTFGEYFIHGKSSGIDVALSTYGKIGSFQYGREIEILDCNMDFNIIIVNSKIERDTKKLVAMVREKLEKDKLLVEDLFEKIDKISNESVKILKNIGCIDSKIDSLKILNEFCSKNNNYLLSLDLGHEETTKICDILSQYDITGKITGAGGGGCIYGIEIQKLDHFTREQLCLDLENHGYNYWFCKLGASGVEKHDVIPEIFNMT